MAYTGSLLPAFSNLPIYNAGLVVPYAPDPTPPDPEPTPVFATRFSGYNVTSPENFFKSNDYPGNYNRASIAFNGVDPDTGFDVPTGAPLFIYPNNTYQGGFRPHGMTIIDNKRGFSTANLAGLNESFYCTLENATIRGLAQKALRIKWLAAGSSSDFGQQAHYTLYRYSDASHADLSECTIRWEIKFPDLSTLLTYPAESGANGRIVFFDYKTAGDFRYTVILLRTGVSSYAWEVRADTDANGIYINPITTYWVFTMTTPAVPQNEWFTFETAFKRPVNHGDLTTGRFRARIRRESDAADVFTTIADVRAETIGILNAAQGTSYNNVHKGPANYKFNRLFHGNYARRKNVDLQIDIAHLRIFDSIL